MFFSNVHPARKKKCMPLEKKNQYWKIKPQVVCGNKQRQGNATGNERQGVWGGGEETQKTEQNQQGGRAQTSLATTYKYVQYCLFTGGRYQFQDMVYLHICWMTKMAQ